MGQPLTVLIIEDRMDDAEMLAAQLTRSGFDATWSRVDSYETLDRALDTPPDLVVCDYSLPGMDPFEVLGRLRDRAPEVPVIVISGVVDEEVATALFPHGASDVLLKDRLARLGQSVSVALSTHDLKLAAREATRRERRTANLLRGLIDHAPAAVSVVAADGSVLLTNCRFVELEQRGLETVQLWPDAGCPARDETGGGEVRVGEETHLWLSFPIRLVGEAEPATGLILMDITAQKQNESELLIARGELAAQAQKLRTRNAELMELDRLKTELVNTVSHELRTPLTSILGYSELLVDQAVAEPGTAPHLMVDMIARNSRRLLHLIDNLLLLAQIDGVTRPRGRGESDVGEVDLAEVVESVALVIVPHTGENAVRVVPEIAEGVPPVSGDRDQLEQVLINLASNAVKFSRPPATVSIRLRGEGEWVVLEVQDTGMGMTEAELAQIGTRFFRGEQARIGHIAGTGLGVSVVRSIVQRHRGTLEYRSAVGEGTTATVRLPRAVTD